MNRDLLNSTNVRRAGQASMTVVDALGRGDLQPHEQLVGLTASFLFLCEHWGVPAQDAFQVTKNVINGAEGKRPEFAAVSEYIKHEVVG